MDRPLTKPWNQAEPEAKSVTADKEVGRGQVLKALRLWRPFKGHVMAHCNLFKGPLERFRKLF